MIELNLQFAPSIKPIDSTAAEKVVRLLAQKLKSKGAVNVKVTSANEVKRLNKRYAGIDETTDVLSFPLGSNPEGELGDVVISSEHLKEQSRAAATDEATELALLVLHGSLHLLGYDHHTKSDSSQMDSLQSEVMKGAGLIYRAFSWQK